MSAATASARARGEPLRACRGKLRSSGGLIVVAIVLLGLLAPWIAPHPLDTMLDAHALPAAERDLLARHRRIRPRRAEPHC